jgi:hypothetical protein
MDCNGLLLLSIMLVSRLLMVSHDVGLHHVEVELGAMMRVTRPPMMVVEKS